MLAVQLQLPEVLWASSLPWQKAVPLRRGLKQVKGYPVSGRQSQGYGLPGNSETEIS